MKTNRIKEVRKEKGITQAGLAEKLGLTSPEISQFEKANSNLTFDTLAKIANALGVNISDLTGEYRDSSESEHNKEELKLCPFCGKKADIVKNICESNNYVGYFVFHDCFLLGSAIKTGLKDSEKEAIKTWNRRIEE